MDSLLLVLTVIGVVMILVGVARMRSKRSQTWDDIDHSVLFNRDEHNKEEKKSLVVEPEFSEPKVAQEIGQLNALVTDEKVSIAAAEPVVVEAPQEDAPVKRSASSGHKFSFLDKIKGEKREDEEEFDGA